MIFFKTFSSVVLNQLGILLNHTSDVICDVMKAAVITVATLRLRVCNPQEFSNGPRKFSG